jgi:hypothetical protein
MAKLKNTTMKICTGCGTTNDEPLGLNRNGEPYLACCPDNHYVEMTAVEWLVSQLNKKGFAQVVTDEEIEQAKEIEKQQIVDAFDGFPLSTRNSQNGEEYYNQTFNK